MRKIVACFGIWVLLIQPSRGDHFDDHNADVLSTVPQSMAVQAVKSLSSTQISQMPHPLEGHSASGFLIVRTDQGNWSKLLVRYARIKKPGTDDPMDLLLIERLVTYPADARRGLEADKSNVYLFPGFALDLDIGQIVPEGTGEDVRLEAQEGGVKLNAMEKATLYAVGRPLVKSNTEAAGKRKFGQGAIQADDFAGDYRLEADGKWSGNVTLKVDESGMVTGTYISDETGQTYDISGRTGNPNNRITFKISFPMTQQEFEGYLWSRNRSRIAGVTHMLGRPFGFVMDRAE